MHSLVVGGVSVFAVSLWVGIWTRVVVCQTWASVRHYHGRHAAARKPTLAACQSSQWLWMDCLVCGNLPLLCHEAVWNCCNQQNMFALARSFSKKVLVQCYPIRLLTALGIDGFCCRKRAFGYLATYSVTCFMNFLLFSWYHAFFPGQLRMLKQPNWNLLGLSCCSLCPAEDVDIPVAASMSSLSGTAGKIQVLISLTWTWSVDLGRRAGCCPHAELDHHNLFQIEYWTIFRCWSSIRFH